MWHKVSKIALVGLLAFSVSAPTVALARGGHGGGHGGSHGGSHGGFKGGSHGGSKGSGGGSKGSTGSHNTSNHGGSTGSKSSSHSSSNHGRSFRPSAIGTPISSWHSLSSQAEFKNGHTSVPSFTSSENTVKTFYSSDTPVNLLMYRPLYGYHHSSAHYLPVQTEEEEKKEDKPFNTAILWVLAAILVPLLALIGYVAFSN